MEITKTLKLEDYFWDPFQYLPFPIAIMNKLVLINIYKPQRLTKVTVRYNKPLSTKLNLKFR